MLRRPTASQLLPGPPYNLLGSPHLGPSHSPCCRCNSFTACSCLFTLEHRWSCLVFLCRMALMLRHVGDVRACWDWLTETARVVRTGARVMRPCCLVRTACSAWASAGGQKMRWVLDAWDFRAFLLYSLALNQCSPCGVSEWLACGLTASCSYRYKQVVSGQLHMWRQHLLIH